ncbi:MAG TPA: Na+/H+ antiporter NhaC family protein [Gemmatimonadales bacterium]|nr:Na+/H+ antiporter NhaC family protein [Gemmatimonadales bacterium]
MSRWRMPHPVVLLVIGVALAAALTWIVPAGAYERAVDPETGRTVAVAGTYAPAPAAPVGPFGVAVAVPRGFVEGADVIATILFVGAAFFLLDKVGSLGRLLGGLVARLEGRERLAIPALVLFFGAMGALENMQEEIIAMVPALLVLGRRLRVDAITVVGASAGAAVVGSAFGPTNPFQAGVALTLAELPTLQGGGLRLAMWAVGLSVWTAWLLRHARRHDHDAPGSPEAVLEAASGRDVLNLALLLLPLGCYVVGALRWDWGFNELSGAFLVGAIAVGLLSGLRADGTTVTLLEGAQAMLPAALLVGLARSISLVLSDGRIIDTILHAMATPLGGVSPTVSALAMVPVQALIHVPVSSVSGQAALTMPIFIPLADLIGLSRQATVLAYQTGAGLMDLLTPTNGALLAVLLAAGVPYQRWVRFAVGGWLLTTAVGIAGILAALTLGL